MNKIEKSKAENAPVEAIKPRRKYDRNFKKEAVALWLNSGKSARQIASELGIAENRLYSWRREFAPAAPAKEADLENQLQALRRTASTRGFALRCTTLHEFALLWTNFK